MLPTNIITNNIKCYKNTILRMNYQGLLHLGMPYVSFDIQENILYESFHGAK